jgi:hypothetical protein
MFYGNNSTPYPSLTTWKVYQPTWEANSISLDPLFVGNGNYSLQGASPACTTGINVGLTTDILGNTVPNPPSMGAYQYASSPPPPPPVLAAPTNEITNLYTTVSFSWNAVSGGTSYGYLIERYYNGIWSTVFSGSQSGTTLQKTMPLNNTQYRWKVSTNGGTYSSYFYFTTLLCN